MLVSEALMVDLAEQRMCVPRHLMVKTVASRNLIWVYSRRAGLRNPKTQPSVMFHAVRQTESESEPYRRLPT